ncbi:MAG: hypothetical protein AB1705_26875 [Verrucomicrobiota bacterium]
MRTSRLIMVFAVAVAAFAGCRNTPIAKTAAQPVISVAVRPTMIRVISQRSGTDITPGIDIFADGRCAVRTFRGEEITKRLRVGEVDSLLVFFEREGLFSVSDATIERAIDRELEPVRTELPGGGFRVSMRGRVLVTDSNHTRIVAQKDSKSVAISRYALNSELEHYRTVTELRTVQRCVDRVYEVAGKIW